MKKTNSFHELVHVISGEHGKLDKLGSIIQLEAELSETVLQLESDLKRERFIHCGLVSDLETAILMAKQKLMTAKSHTAANNRLMRSTAHAQTCSVARLLMQQLNSEEWQISQFGIKQGTERQAHRSTVEILRCKQGELSSAMDHHKETYQIDIGRLTSDLEKIIDVRATQLHRLEILQDRRLAEIEVEQLVLAKSSIEGDANRHRIAEEAKRDASARVVQIAVRKCLLRNTTEHACVPEARNKKARKQ